MKPKNEKQIRSVFEKLPENYGSLGKEIRISPKSVVSVNQAGFKTNWLVPTIEVLIGIGKDHTAHLVMDTDAWNALKKGATIDITTLKEFKKKFL